MNQSASNRVGRRTHTRGLKAWWLSGAAIAPLALAATEPTPSEPTRAEGTQLEEVIVTARKRAENNQSVPVAITAITSQALEERDVRTLVDVSRYTPGLIFDRGAGVNGGSFGASAYIRGVGQRNAQPVADPAVGIYVDGVYFGRVVGSVLNVVDADRVEVLRGPQGTLYGKNTLGGAINIASKMPVGDFGGYADLGFGTYNERNSKTSLEFPIITGKLAARLSFSSMEHDGYDPDRIIGEDLGSLNFRAGRTILRWTPNDDFVATFTADISRERDTPQALHPTVIVPTPKNGIGQYNLFVSGSLSGGAGAFDSRYVTRGRDSLATGTFLSGFSDDLDAWGAAANLEWNLRPDMALTSITGYRWMKTHVGSDPDGSPISYYANEVFDRQNQWSQELRLGGSAVDDRLKWQVGGYYAVEDINDVSFITKAPAAPPPLGFRVRQQIDATNTSWAAFTQETFKILDKLSVTAGVRYNRDKKDNVAQSLFNGHVNFPPTPLDGSWNSTTPRVSLEYNSSDDFLTYLSYAEGFKSGGVNYQLLSLRDFTLFNPEKASTWELGSKLQFFDRRLRVNTALFRTAYKDIQFEHLFFNPVVCGTRTFFCSRTLNAAEARIQGVEVETTAAPVRGLELFANVAYMQSKVTKVDPALIALRAFDPTVLNLGTTLPRTPDWTVTTGASYSFDVGQRGKLTLRADYSYKSRVYFDSADVRGAAQAGYGIANAGISFDTISGRWQFALNAQNLADKLYATNGTGTTFPADGYAVVSYGAPRTVTGSFRYRFGVH
jgi:iron complex outermembrane receptor protein